MTPQLNIRTDPAIEARLAAAAGALDETKSELVRRMVEDSLPAVEERARKAAALRVGLPAGVTEQAVSTAVGDVLKTINRNEYLELAPRDLLTPKAKAIYRVLAVIWGEDELSVKTRQKLSGDVGTAAAPHVVVTPPTEVASKPVKTYPRRNS